MALDNDTKTELSRESTRMREKAFERIAEEFGEWVLDNIAYHSEDTDSLEFLEECVGFLLEEFILTIRNKNSHE